MRLLAYLSKYDTQNYSQHYDEKILHFFLISTDQIIILQEYNLRSENLIIIFFKTQSPSKLQA